MLGDIQGSVRYITTSEYATTRVRQWYDILLYKNITIFSIAYLQTYYITFHFPYFLSLALSTMSQIQTLVITLLFLFPVTLLTRLRRPGA